MPHIGSLEPYDGVEAPTAYLERLDEFFVANDIGQVRVADGANQAAVDVATRAADRKKVASLLTLLGKKGYGVL